MFLMKSRLTTSTRNDKDARARVAPQRDETLVIRTDTTISGLDKQDRTAIFVAQIVK